MAHNLGHLDRLLFVLEDKGLITNVHESDTSPKIFTLCSSLQCQSAEQKIIKYSENNDRIAIPQSQSLFYDISLLKALSKIGTYPKENVHCKRARALKIPSSFGELH